MSGAIRNSTRSMEYTAYYICERGFHSIFPRRDYFPPPRAPRAQCRSTVCIPETCSCGEVPREVRAARVAFRACCKDGML